MIKNITNNPFEGPQEGQKLEKSPKQNQGFETKKQEKPIPKRSSSKAKILNLKQSQVSMVTIIDVNRPGAGFMTFFVPFLGLFQILENKRQKKRRQTKRILKQTNG